MELVREAGATGEVALTQAYPLAWPEGWPRAKSRKEAQFGKNEPQYRDGQHTYDQKRSLSIEDAIKRVRAELDKLGVNVRDDSIVSTNLKLNMSGLPRGDQGAPSDPGVAIYWQKKGQPMRVMAIDRYYRVADNIAAIAATLNAMRAIERHGGAQILDRAFTGFTALPPPFAWWQVLGLPRTATVEEVKAEHRRLAVLHHPDRENGSAARMAEINAARDAALKEMAA